MKNFLRLAFIAGLLVLSQVTHAQTLSLVKDLNAGTADGLDEWNNQGFAFNNSIFMPATNGTSGLELYILKNNQLTLLKDINPGADGSAPQNFVLYKNKVYFTATTTDNGTEIWSTDGTETGTQLSIETIAGPSPSTGPGILVPAANGKLYYSLDGNVYLSDGTTAGTSIITNIGNVDFNADNSVASPNVTTYGQGIAFYSQSNKEVNIYKHDGTTLTLLKSLTLGFFTDVFGLAEVSTGLLYAIDDSFDDALNGLFIINKTTNTSSQILDASSKSFAVNRVLQFNGKKAIFKGLSGGIYATDGTTAGTVKITEATYTLYQGQKIPHAVFGDQIFFYGDKGFFVEKMYVSDGTVAGTVLAGTSTEPQLGNVIKSGNTAYWISGVNNGFTTEIWVTDITKKASAKIYSFTEDATTDESLLLGVSDSKLYIGSSLKGEGREVYSMGLTTGIADDIVLANTYKLATLQENNQYKIVSKNIEESISVTQIDATGNSLTSLVSKTNTAFTLADNQGLSIVKVSTEKGVITYKIVR